jgi:DDE superfamily endonuclease
MLHVFHQNPAFFIMITLLCSNQVEATIGTSFVVSPVMCVLLIVAMIIAVEPELLALGEPPKKKQRDFETAPAIRRTRRKISDIMSELGETYTRRAYRMKEQSFWKLHTLLLPILNSCSSTSQKTWENGATNGVISTSIRLSIALPYFAGGCPYNISIVHGVSHSAVYESVWQVVDAVNKCNALSFEFPEDHAAQREIAKGFAERSQAGFKTCVGATDGILIWIHQPNEEECKGNDAGAKKFFCGCKKKYGVNMQATCDSKCRFLEIDVHHPGATSDFLAFFMSEFKTKLEEPGFLADGLCLFGDNAYVNTSYMATPFKSVSSGPKDAYNFYHSQLRITIERCFGMFVHRWGILRKPMSQNLSLAKINAIILCLARLHNFCIDMNDGKPKACLAIDRLNIALEGGGMYDESTNLHRLLGGGHHFGDDLERSIRRQYDDPERNVRRRRNDPERNVYRHRLSIGITGHVEENELLNRLPRDLLLNIVVDDDLRRPPPLGKRQRST